MKLLFSFDQQKCSACGACAIACMDQNDIDVSAGQAPYRKVFLEEHDGTPVYRSESCRHCADAPCVRACPLGCLFKDAATGLTGYDNTRCVGCHACAKACPYGAVSFRPTGLARPKERMEKCHGCLVRIEAGLTPACVHACPTGALTWRWAEESPDQSNNESSILQEKEGITMKEIIATPNAPAAIGPYSQAVKAGGTLYVSGQLPIDPATGEFAAQDIGGQTQASLRNIGEILKQAGYTFDDVVKTTVMLSDIANFAPMNEVYATFFTGSCPARAAFAVKDLPKGALVEIEAIAYRA